MALALTIGALVLGGSHFTDKGPPALVPGAHELLHEGRPEFASRDGRLFMNEEPLLLKGINWYGFGTDQGVFLGLYAQPAEWFLDFLEETQFNAVRVPLDLDLILDDGRQPGYITPGNRTCSMEQWSQLNLNISFDKRSTLPTQRDVLRDATRRDELLQERALAARGSPCASPLSEMSSLEVLDWFIDAFAARGILVLLDLHCLSPGCLAKSGGQKIIQGPQLFYDNTHPVEKVLEGWSTLAHRYSGKWKCGRSHSNTSLESDC